MKLIALSAWATKNKIVYSTAIKMFETGQLEGAYKIGRLTKVPETTLPPLRGCISCMVCGQEMPQITSTHLLKRHNITFAQYIALYPNAKTCSDEVSKKISDKNSGAKRSEETIAKISKSKKGSVPHNKGIKGIFFASDETKKKMSESQTGRTHSDITKTKIGDAHRGVSETPEAIANMKAGLKKYYKNNESALKGRELPDWHIDILQTAAQKREKEYTVEQRAEINRKIGISGTGKIRTDEQKETYREARSKYMEENPITVKSTAGERTIMAWLDAHGIVYRRQFRVSKCHHPFDFFIPTHNVIIEFDGSHHWYAPWFGVRGKNQIERDTILAKQLEKDAIENLIAGKNGHRIARIRGHADVGSVIAGYGNFEEQMIEQGFGEVVK